MKTAKKKKIKKRTKKQSYSKQPTICAPGTADSFTCFTKDALINIIRAWNSHYKEDKIEYSINDRLGGWLFCRLLLPN